MPRLVVLVALAAFTALGSACGAGAAVEVRGPADAPEPPSEPRATLVVQVDLERSPSCEERFDLALYESRAVELVAWEPSVTPCVARRATVHYFPRRTTPEALQKKIQTLSIHTQVIGS